MKKPIALLIAVLMICLLLPAKAEAAADYSWIKVKLSTNNATALTVYVSGSYFIQENGKSFSGGTLTISAASGRLSITHSKAGLLYEGSSAQIMREKIDRTAGHLRLNGRNYLGHFNLRVTGSGYIQVVNVVPLAHYLYGVVGFEMNNNFPLEALKAQAVAAKCYVLNLISTTGEYYIGDTSADQVYKGYDSSANNVIAAVDSTLNDALFANGQILTTYFAASNGGETNLVTNAWTGRGTNAGYALTLDDYDILNPESVKETVFFPIGGGSMSSALYSMLCAKASSAMGTGIASIDAILSVETYGPAYSGSVRNLTKATVNMLVTTGTGTPQSGSFGDSGLSSTFGDAPQTPQPAPTNAPAGQQTQVSVTFNLGELYAYRVVKNASLRIYWGEPVPGGYNIYHVRYGHGVGLSQRGAQQRAKYGQSYQQILSFYYPGATLGTITVNPPQDPVKPEVPDQANPPQGAPAAKGVTTGTVNFRSGPGTSYGIIGQLLKGTAVDVYSHDGSWAQVVVNGTAGYVSMQYLTVTSISSDPNQDKGDEGDEDEDQAAGEQPGKTVQAYGEVTGSGVNFRTGPGVTYTSLGKLDKGARLSIYGQSGNWYHAETSGLEGYISTSYVKLTEEPGGQQDTDGGSDNKTTITYTIGYVTGSGVNFRKQATSASESMGRLAKNTTLLVFSQHGDWYYAQAGGMNGYVYADYVKLTDETHTVEITPPKTETQAEAAEGVTTGSVNFRTGPSTSYSKLTSLASGTKIKLYSLADGWYFAEYDGKKGYVSSAYVKVTANPERITDGSSQADTQKPGTGDSGSFSSTGLVTNDGVNFRSGPSTSYKKLATLNKGTTLTLHSLSDGWYKANYGSTQGYISAKYVKVVSETDSSGQDSKQETPTLGRTTGKLNLRTGPSTNHAIIELLSRDCELKILGQTGDWYYVQCGSKTGYVSKAYVKITQAGSEGIKTIDASGTAGNGVYGVTTADTHLRQSSNSEGEVLATLKKGTTIVVYNDVDGWSLVYAQSKLGYVESKHIKLN